MNKSTLTVSVDEAPGIIAGLIREGVGFNARTDEGRVIIVFTGGY